MAGCTVGRESLNAQLPVLQADIDAQLARDELEAADPAARSLEARLPGVDTFALLGRVLWRTGHLIDAESYHRRSAAAGLPEAHLGLARARLADREIVAAAELLAPLVRVESLADRAHRLRAALSLAEGDPVAAAAELEAASSVPANPRAELDRLEAEALRLLDAPHGVWAGSHSVLDLTAEATIEGVVDGRPARVLIDPLASRSAVAPSLVDSAENVASVRIELGSVRTAAVVRVEELSEDTDLRLGFDLLVSLQWALDPGAGRFEAAPAERGVVVPQALARTHWTAIRVPRDGLAAQLIVLPRVDGRLVTAGLDLRGPTRIDRRSVPGNADAREGDRVTIEVRVGARRDDVEAEVVDLYPLGHDGAVAPRVVLGRELLLDWRIVWAPGDRQLAMEGPERR